VRGSLGFRDRLPARRGPGTRLRHQSLQSPASFCLSSRLGSIPGAQGNGRDQPSHLRRPHDAIAAHVPPPPTAPDPVCCTAPPQHPRWEHTRCRRNPAAPPNAHVARTRAFGPRPPQPPPTHGPPGGEREKGGHVIRFPVGEAPQRLRHQSLQSPASRDLRLNRSHLL